MKPYRRFARRVTPSWTSAAFVIVALLASADAFAQTREQCRDALERAEDQYDLGRYDEVIGALRLCAEQVPEAARLRAYKLLALAYLKMQERDRAEQAVTHLLQENPNFTPDPEQDSQEFVDLVN